MSPKDQGRFFPTASARSAWRNIMGSLVETHYKEEFNEQETVPRYDYMLQQYSRN